MVPRIIRHQTEEGKKTSVMWDVLAAGHWKIISLGTWRDDRGSDQSCPIRLVMNQFLSSIARGAPMQELLAFSVSVQCRRHRTELAPWWASVVKPSAHTYQ